MYSNRHRDTHLTPAKTNMMESTYALTLVNDHPFYTAVRKELYMEVFTIANILHDAYHSDEGLTMVDRYSAIVTAIERIQENT